MRRLEQQDVEMNAYVELLRVETIIESAAEQSILRVLRTRGSSELEERVKLPDGTAVRTCAQTAGLAKDARGGGMLVRLGVAELRNAIRQS
jgi:hypothetical protein